MGSTFQKLSTSLEKAKRYFKAWKPVKQVDRVLKKTEGYHFGIRWCAAISTVVFVVNLSTTIWAAKYYGVSGGFGTIQSGDCSQIKDLSFWLHMLINVLSTLLLGASNYTMQCLSSPTRHDIDKAHRRRVWLDIGIPSLRNLRRVARSRQFQWWLIALSSVPLHLLYNSAVFSTLSAREYSVFLVASDFVGGAPFAAEGWKWSSDEDVSRWEGRSYAELHPQLQTLQKSSSNLRNKSGSACLDTYRPGKFTSTHADVLFISSAINSSNSLLGFIPNKTPNFANLGTLPVDRRSNFRAYWPEAMCSSLTTCTDKAMSAARENDDQWARESSWHLIDPDTATIPSQCLEQPVEEHCQLQFSLAMSVIVIICNLVKVCIMALIAWQQPMEPLVRSFWSIFLDLTLTIEGVHGPNGMLYQAADFDVGRQVTIGDAIASFLDRPDLTTEGNCLSKKGQFRSTRICGVPGKHWGPKNSRFWFAAASTFRWILCYGLYGFVLSTTALVLGLSFGSNSWNGADKSLSHLYTLGFGEVTLEGLSTMSLPGSWGLCLTTIIANSPQLLLSFCYLTFNCIFTCMLVAQEWNSYSQKRRYLRVTSPQGSQRSTYRLQLPYRYSIPLLVASGVLHWLTSQSLFLARVTTYDKHDQPNKTQSISTVGYSPIAMTTLLIFGATLCLLELANGFRRFKPGLPLSGCCSAVISAACHPATDDEDAATKPVMWGVVGSGKFINEKDEVVGHCTFTSFEVEEPVVGQLYA